MRECWSIFNEEDIAVSLNEALILEAIGINKVTKREIAKVVFKDKAYIHRSIESLTKKRLVEKEGNFYFLTDEGIKAFEHSKEICKEVIASHKDSLRFIVKNH